MILFIDDEPAYVGSYVDELRDAGYEVVIERGVDAAIEFVAAKKSEIELIVLDIMMPPGATFKAIDTSMGLRTGVHLYDWLRHNGSTHPVIILTNVEKPEVEQKFVDEKSCMVLHKGQCLPFELVDHVKAMLGWR
jgi:DNA-binding response OmpR family regulator